MTDARTTATAGAPALFRLALADGSTRLSVGATRSGPEHLIDASVTIAQILRGGRDGLDEAIRFPSCGPVPDEARILAPVDTQEVWAAGVTYRRSHAARAEETSERSVYDRVYTADRPELFFKANGWRVQASGTPIGIRMDSAWNVPEPELVLVVSADLQIAGYTIGDDVSSRSIEGENPLYLPQAKVYRRSCAIGPALVPVASVGLPVDLGLTIRRGGVVAFRGTASTGEIQRPLKELVAYLGRVMDFPDGVFLMTGTGVVPDAPFTLAAGDVVTIDGGPLGVLENPVEVVG